MCREAWDAGGVFKEVWGICCTRTTPTSFRNHLAAQEIWWRVMVKVCTAFGLTVSEAKTGTM